MDEATVMAIRDYANKMSSPVSIKVRWDILLDLAQFWLDNHKPTPTTDWGDAQVNVYAKVEDQNG